MAKSLIVKRNKIKKVLFCVCFAISIMMFSTTVKAQTILYTGTTDKVEAKEFEFYQGKVTRDVNVRVDAGGKKDKVMVDGKGVVLSKGTIVTIIDSKKVGSKPWYKVRFTYKGKEMEGFATSAYITKTGEVITPIPTLTPTLAPTPEPTPEPTLAPTLEPTPEAVEITKTVVPVQESKMDQETQNHGNNLKYVVVIFLAIGVSGGVIYLFLRKKKTVMEKAIQASEKIAKLKSATVTTKDVANSPKDTANSPKDTANSPKSANTLKDATNNASKTDKKMVSKEKDDSFEDKKRQEARLSKRDKVLSRTELLANKSEVYVVKSKEDSVKKELRFTEALEAINLNEIESDKEHNTRQSDNVDRKDLRITINSLRQHDIILHKFFGKGEVYDNSDVRLIEVRFGNDVRFLNKEQLVNKKLIQITNEKAE